MTTHPGDSVNVIHSSRPKEAYRVYQKETRSSVKAFYRLNHTNQTFDFVLGKKQEFLKLNQRKMGIWETMEYLNTYVDDSDPDIDLPQLDHLLQTAEAIRKDGHPRWFILTGLIHDLGKILGLFGEPSWAVVGDTYPVGCRFSDKIVFSEYFSQNPDSKNPAYQTLTGIYEEGCGLDNVHFAWGHDEYLYQVIKDYLPDPAPFIIRYHSFYPGHRENAYPQLMNAHDREMFKWLRTFSQYDLYSKSDDPATVDELKPFYMELIAEYLPATLRW